MNIKQTIIFVKLLILSNLVLGSSPIKSDSFTITGEIDDPIFASHKDFESSITIIVSELPFNLVEILTSPHQIITVKCLPGASFKTTIPTDSEHNYIYISYTSPVSQVSTSRYNWIDNIYIIQKGDSVNCKLNKYCNFFTGKGANKMQCQSEIYFAKYSIDPQLDQKLKDKNTCISALAELERKSDSVFFIQKAILGKYKGVISDEMTSVLFVNCLAFKYYGFFRAISKRDSNLLIPLFESTFYKKISHYMLEIDDAAMYKSPVFSSVLLQKIRFEVYFDSNDKVNHEDDYSHLLSCYDVIWSKYSGLLRDKLIAQLMLIRPSQTIRLGNTLIGKIQDSLFRKKIEKLILSKSVGTSLDQYELTNIKGNRTKMSQFNNKVVLLDFWFSGCLPCINLRKSLQPIYSKYENNKDILFVSVNIDEDIGFWRNSVETGKYTFPNGVDLFTSGLAAKHPLIVNLMISSYPTLLLIKNGKIYSSTVPIPRGPSDLKEVQALVDIIESAL